MTVPFLCVLAMLLLMILSKLPVVIAQMQQPGGYDNRHPRDQQQQLEGWGHRSVAAHLNTIEAFPMFAAAVIINHLAGADVLWSARLAVAFVAVRVLYIALYLANRHALRSISWNLGFLLILGLFILPFFG